MNKHQTTAKEYLMKAYRVDERIQNKLMQVDSLSALATKATTTISDMPGSPSKDPHKLENIVVKIVELQEEIGGDIEKLLVLKKDILGRIRCIEDPELQMVLELRYLSYLTWEHIAAKMGYSEDNIFILHRKALEKMTIPEALQ